MTLSPLHVVLIDPWVPAPADLGPDRSRTLAEGIAAAGHRVTRLGGRPAAAGERPSLPPLPEIFGSPSAARPGRGYGLRLFAALMGLSAVDIAVLRLPPLKGALAAVFFSVLSGAPLALDVRSIAPVHPGQGSVSRLIDRLRLAALRWRVRHIFAATPDIKAWLEAHGFAPALITISPDGCEINNSEQGQAEAAQILQRYPALARGPLAVYAGRLNRGRPVAELLDIAAAMKPLMPDLNFMIVGDGPIRLDLNAYAARLDVLEKNVWFVPAQPRPTITGLLTAATLAIALPPRMHNGGLEAGSHIFENLAAGKPVAVLGDGWQRELIEGRQAGVALPVNAPEAAARELADFLSNGDLVRRAGEQAHALAHGKHNAARVIVEARQALEKTVAHHSRSDVMLMRYAFFKRTLDVVCAATALVILSPVILMVALAMLAAGWAPIAGRDRGGLRTRPFKLYTFDTMKSEQGRGPSQPETWAHTLARILRRTAIDRVPELFNVLMGDMSLVGPRPLPAAYSAYYTEKQLRRLEVRPGITGWAQVNGREGLTWEEMFDHDYWYVTNRSFGLDLKILLKTFAGLILGRSSAPLPSGQLPRFDEIEARRQGAEDA